MPDVPRRARLTVIAVGVTALVAVIAFLLTDRDYAGPQNPSPSAAAPGRHAKGERSSPDAPSAEGAGPGEAAAHRKHADPGDPAADGKHRHADDAAADKKHPRPDDASAGKKMRHPPRETVIIQRPGRGALADEQSADTFMQFDTDRDGAVDRYEARYSEFLSANFDLIDSSRDGRISADEMRAFDLKRFSR